MSPDRIRRLALQALDQYIRGADPRSLFSTLDRLEDAIGRKGFRSLAARMPFHQQRAFLDMVSE